ncbi:MAG: DUF927 domain-containing protein [Gammaproteobacteria bacterium]|nr:DUF927 domain-containing protein [Gammaproteobacteria bacterium]
MKVSKLPAGHRIPKGYSITDTTTEYTKVARSVTEHITMCAGSVAITGKGCNIDDGQAYLDVAFDSSVGKNRRVNEVLSQRSALSKGGIMELADKGLNIPESQSASMNKYLSNYLLINDDAIQERIMTNRNGWKHDYTMFVCGTRGITIDDVIDVTPTDVDISTHMKASGTLEEWYHTVADVMTTFEVMRFKMYVAMTAPLLRLLKVGNFILDNHALSGQLKTTTCDIAMSAYGDPIGLQQSANLTINAAEIKAVLSNDCCFFLDETSNATVDFMTQFIYMTGNGRQKGRGKKEGGLRKEETFAVVALTTGEKPIISSNSMGGVDARLIEYDGGIYDKYDSIEMVKDGISANHGTFIEAYIQHILRNKTNVVERHNELSAEFEGDSGRDHRKSRQFAAIAVAGELFDEMSTDFMQHDTSAVEIVRSVYEKTSKQQTKLEYHIRALQVFSDWYDRFENMLLPRTLLDERDDTDDRHIPHQIEGYYDDKKIYVSNSVMSKILKDGDFDMRAVKEPWTKLGITVDSNNGKQVMQMQTKPMIAGRQRWMVTIDKRTMSIVLGAVDDEAYDM